MKTILLLSVGVLCAFTGVRLETAEKKIKARAIHPRYREWAIPTASERVRQNPPQMLWPANKKSDVTYSVRLSQDKTFPDKRTIYSGDFQWAEYCHHSLLKKGKWYWQWSTTDKSGKKTWSDVMEFVVDNNSRDFATPSIKKLNGEISKIPHHRLYVTKEELENFRMRNSKNSEAQSLVRNTRKKIDMELIPEAPTRPRDTTGMNAYEQQLMMSFMYHGFGDKVKKPIVDFCLSYLLTGEEYFARAAIKHAVHIAMIDPGSPGTIEDFNTSSIILALATAYDTTYDLLSEDEKSVLLSSIQVRTERLYNHYVKDFETHSMDNHVWQHTFRRLFLTSIAVIGDLPQAEEWLAYCYETWCCRFPILTGSEDGGWHDGSSYYAVNFKTFIYMPYFLKRFSGVDFFDLPWFRNVPEWLAYSFPKGSYSTGFGDSFETMISPPKSYMGFADALARETGDPLARWYANQLADGKSENLHKDTNFTIYRMLTDKKPEDVEGIAPEKNSSRFFPDAGFSLMHTDPANVSDDLMAVFMDVPFGSTGHAHAAHNGFTINYGGRQLFGATGYYSHFSDRHTLMHYRTMGHNTILADGLAQAIGENGYGWLARFEDNPSFTYTLGDATHAYDSMLTPFWVDRMQNMGIEYKPENGFGDPGITRFRRHFLFLRPNTIVIYDELEAEKPVTWTWMLRSANKISTVDDSRYGNIYSSTVMANNGLANGRAEIFADCRLNTSVSNEFFYPAENWRSKTGEDGKVTVYEKQWHANFDTENKSRIQRFLSIITVDAGNNGDIPAVIVSNGTFKVGDWTIEATFNKNNPAMLKAINTKEDAILYNTEVSKISYSTVIRYNKTKRKELIDKIPISVRLP